jgi:hypothetical protein
MVAMGINIVATLTGIAVALILEYWAQLHWYISVPLGAIGYFIFRYIGRAYNDSRRIDRQIDEAVNDATSDSDSQNSN